MLSDDAKQRLTERQSLADSLHSLPPGHTATAASHLAREGASQGTSNDTSAEKDLVTGLLRASTPSDLRKRQDGTRISLNTAVDWSLRMINNGTRLDELLLDKTVSDGEFASAARALLVTKFPNEDLNKYTLLAKQVKLDYIENWRTTLLAISVYYRHYKKFPGPVELNEYLGGSNEYKTIDFDILNKYLADPNTDAVLSELGVSSPTMGLSERQLLALSMLTSFSDARPLQAKLKSIGINHWEFNNWLGYPKFQTAYRKITEDLLSEVQPVINTALVQLATGWTTGKPDLSSIKYLNELNGRWDPASRQVMDIRVFMTKVVDILTQELADDPAKLQRIGARLAGAANSGTVVEGQTEIESGPTP